MGYVDSHLIRDVAFGVLAQLVERALSMCKVRSSTLLRSILFFFVAYRVCA